MALLVLAAAVRERTDPTLDSLAVLSVDHGLRPESRAECAAAIALAEELGIARRECRCVSVSSVGNTLEAAREARYAAAREFVEHHDCSAAVAAHTADDRAESLILSLRRGHGLTALTRLLPVRTYADRSMPAMVRPLLGARRAALRAFLAEIGVSWHDDPSNAKHERGELRGDPSLANLVDHIASGSSRLLDEASELAQFRDEELAARLEPGTTVLAREEFDRIPGALRAAALRALALAAGGEIANRSLDRALAALRDRDRSPHRFACSCGVELSINAREVRAARKP
jgi:tRNA(Ile)-lysidine synthase